MAGFKGVALAAFAGGGWRSVLAALGVGKGVDFEVSALASNLWITYLTD